MFRSEVVELKISETGGLERLAVVMCVCEQLRVCVCVFVCVQPKSSEKLGLILVLRCGSKLMCFFCHCKKKKKIISGHMR